MKETYREAIVSTSSTNLIAEQKMAAGPPVKVIEASDLAPQVIGHNKYRIELDGVNSIFYCEETGIKFKVKSKTILEYSLEYGDVYINLIQEHGYELLGPIFNVNVISGKVLVVYLPHYVCLEDSKDKPFIKFGNLKDGKVSLKSPSDIDSSYVVREHPTFSCVAPIGERVTSFLRRRMKPHQFNGRVVLYSRVLCPGNAKLQELRIHLYLIPADRHKLKKLDDWMGHKGFKNIDKPGVIKNVSTTIKYIISGKPTSNISPTTLEFSIHKPIEEYPYCEINISRIDEAVSLNMADNSPDSEPLWKGLLTRADIAELSRQAAPKAVFSEHFIDEHRSELIEKVTNIKPVLDELKEKELLTKEQCNVIMTNATSQDKMREILNFVDGWSPEDKQMFLQVLRKHNKLIIKGIIKGEVTPQ